MSCFENIEYKENDFLLLNPLTIESNLITLSKDNCGLDSFVVGEDNEITKIDPDCDYFKIKNNLSELKTQFLKSKARKNLGISDISIILLTENSNLNDYIEVGIYDIKGTKTNEDNIPIINEGIIAARLNVLVTENGDNKVITQVLNLNNNHGGEGNIYIRSNQNGIWKPWGKLQTNVEVGQITPDDMSNITDNGIYSGVCVDGTTIETFVLIVINNYLVASQAGFGSYISLLKYAIDLNRGNTVKTRTRDAYGIWEDWKEIDGEGSNEVDITDAVKTYGLPTLVNQGFTKEGVNYIINFNGEDLNQKNIILDSEGKLADFFKDKYHNSSDGGYIKFNYKVLKGQQDFNTRSIDGIFCSDFTKYNFYITYGTKSELVIQISQDMTTL